MESRRGSRIAARLAGQARIQEIKDRPVETGDEVTQLKLVKAATEEGGEDEVLAEKFGTKIFTSGDRFYPGLEAHLSAWAQERSERERSRSQSPASLSTSRARQSRRASRCSASRPAWRPS